MLIVLLDEPGLFVFPTAPAAVQQIEPIDAELEVRAAFDESAVPYRVEWLRPNQHRKILWGFGTVVPGEYAFVPAGPADPNALITLLQQHSEYTNPPEAKAELESLLEKLRAN